MKKRLSQMILMGATFYSLSWLAGEVAQAGPLSDGKDITMKDMMSREPKRGGSPAKASEKTAKDPGSSVELEESSYSACKGVKFVSAKDYEKNQSYWNKRCNSGQESIQVLSSSGGLFTDLQNATASLAFLQEVGDRAREVMDDKIAEAESIQKCFQESEAKNSSCAMIRKDVVNAAYGNMDELRLELALSEGKGPSRSGGKVAFPSAAEAVNSGLKKSYLGLVGVYRPDDMEGMSSGEKFVAEDKMANEIEQIQKKAKSEDEKKQLFEAVRAAHKANYLMLLQKAPALTFIGKLPNRNDEKAVNARFAKAYSELIEATKKERVRLRTAQNALVYNGKGTDQTKAKELLSVMAYAPIVDEVIKEQKKKNPAVCALATSLSQSHESTETSKSLVTAGAMIAGGVAVSALSGGMGGIPLIGGMTISGQTAAALALGPGLGYAMRVEARNDMSKAKGGVAAGVKNADAIDNADTNVVIGNASMGTLDLIGTGAFKAAGGAVFKSFAKAALTSEGLAAEEAAKLIAASQGQGKVAEQAREQIRGAMKKQIFGTAEPSAEETAAYAAMEGKGLAKSPESVRDFYARLGKLQKGERQETARNAVDMIKNLNPAKFETATEKELTDLNRQVVAIARYGKVKDPKKIAAVFAEWDASAREGLASVYDDAGKILKDPKFMSGKSLKERREAAFKQALENKGVPKNQVAAYCQCPGECGGGAKVASNLVDDQLLDRMHVCVKDENTIWFLPQLSKHKS